MTTLLYAENAMTEQLEPSSDSDNWWQQIVVHRKLISDVCAAKRNKYRNYPAVRRLQLQELVSDVIVFIYEHVAVYDSSRAEIEHYIKALASYGAGKCIYRVIRRSIENIEHQSELPIETLYSEKFSPEKVYFEGVEGYIMVGENMLSPRRKRIVELLLQGSTQQEIAIHLGISQKTVSVELLEAQRIIREFEFSDE